MELITKQPLKEGANQSDNLSIPEYIYHLSRELEIENICGVNGNEMELIALIRNCPFLYNPAYPDFKVADKRDQAWKAIAKVFSVSTNELQHHWKHMRESFKKYSCKGNLDPNIKACVTYFDEMKFLVPFMNRDLVEYPQKQQTISEKMAIPVLQVN